MAALQFRDIVGFGRRTVGLGLCFLLASSIQSAKVAGQDTVPNLNAPRFALSGEVRDASTNQPVVAAVIKVPELELYTFTRGDGRFLIDDFPAGTWDIVVQQLGYETVDGRFTVADGNGLLIRMIPDPVALRGFEVLARSQRLIYERSRLVPFRVRTISPALIEQSAHPDPASIFRAHSGSPITGCSNDSDEWMTPGCMWFRGRATPIAVFVDEGPLLGGMPELALHRAYEIHSMEWIPRMQMLRVYTKKFIERLDESRISLTPLVW